MQKAVKNGEDTFLKQSKKIKFPILMANFIFMFLKII